MAPSPICFRQGRFEVLLAETPAQIAACQRLRHLCFLGDAAGTDADPLDEIADHLIVRDLEGDGQIVGTYRLMRSAQAREAGGWYTAGEFDLSFLDQLNGGKLELGRSCVDPAHRKSGVATLLWLGIGGYVAAYDIDVLFGCGSFPGTDPQAHAAALGYLHRHCPPPPDVTVRPAEGLRSDQIFSLNDFAGHAPDSPREAAKSLPSLIKGYAHMSAWFGQTGFIDHDFGVLDVLVCVTADAAPKSYHKRFKRPDFVRPEFLKR